MRRGKRSAASSTRARTSGSAASSQAIPTRTSSSDSSRLGSKPGASAAIAASHSSTVRAIGPAWSKLGASGKQPSSGTSPHVGLKPTMPHQAAGMRIEPPESVPSADVGEPGCERGAVPAARPAREPAGCDRVRDGAEVRILGRGPVGELVQVRLADVRVARALEPDDGLGRCNRDVLGEQDRPVRRRQAGGVEEVLDGQPKTCRRRRVGQGEEDAVVRARARDVTSSGRACA